MSDTLSGESGLMERELATAHGELARAKEAIRAMLLSADAQWESKGMGHDWASAVQAARKVLSGSAA